MHPSMRERGRAIPESNYIYLFFNSLLLISQ